MRDLALQRSDIVVYELDRPALDTALAKVFGLIEETDAGTDLPERRASAFTLHTPDTVSRST